MSRNYQQTEEFVREGVRHADRANTPRRDGIFYMLEHPERNGMWLEDAYGSVTSSPQHAMTWPAEHLADAFRRNLAHPLWMFRVTEHKWMDLK